GRARRPGDPGSRAPRLLEDARRGGDGAGGPRPCEGARPGCGARARVAGAGPATRRRSSGGASQRLHRGVLLGRRRGLRPRPALHVDRPPPAPGVGARRRAQARRRGRGAGGGSRPLAEHLPQPDRDRGAAPAAGDGPGRGRAARAVRRGPARRGLRAGASPRTPSGRRGARRARPAGARRAGCPRPPLGARGGGGGLRRRHRSGDDAVPPRRPPILADHRFRAPGAARSQPPPVDRAAARRGRGVRPRGGTPARPDSRTSLRPGALVSSAGGGAGERALRIAPLGLALALSATLLLYWGRGQTLGGDELHYAYRLSAQSLGHAMLYPPPDGYLIAAPLAVYKGLFETAGLGAYWVHRLVAVALVLACAVLFWAVARRAVGDLRALAPTVLLLLFGYGSEMVLTAERIPGLMALAAGLGALAALR